MTKNLANKLRLKERLYTIRMAKGIPIQSRLNEFNSIIIDLENRDVQIEDEDKAILLLVSLPATFKHFKEIMLYGNNGDSLSFEDVKSNLLSKENFNNDPRSEVKIEWLSVRGRSQHKGDSVRSHSRSKSRGPKTNNNYCRYCNHSGHDISSCFKLTKKEEREKNTPEKPGEASLAANDSCGEVLNPNSWHRSRV